MATKKTSSKKTSPHPYFIKLDETGALWKGGKTPHAMVHDTRSGLIWPAELPGTKEFRFSEIAAAGKECRLFGFKDWFAGLIDPMSMIFDRTRFSPAIDTEFFRFPKSGWVWSASRVPASPHGYAFGVVLHSGSTGWNGQYGKGLLLPCRPAPRARQ